MRTKRSPPKNPRKKRFGCVRWYRLLLLLLITKTVLLFWGWQPLVKHLLTLTLAQQWQQPVYIAEIKLNQNHIILSHIHIGNHLHLPQLTIHWSYHARHLKIINLTLKGLTLLWSTPGDERRWLPLTPETAKEEKTSPPPIRFTLQQIQCQSCRIDLQSPPKSEAYLNLNVKQQSHKQWLMVSGLTWRSTTEMFSMTLDTLIQETLNSRLHITAWQSQLTAKADLQKGWIKKWLKNRPIQGEISTTLHTQGRFKAPFNPEQPWPQQLNNLEIAAQGRWQINNGAYQKQLSKSQTSGHYELKGKQNHWFLTSTKPWVVQTILSDTLQKKLLLPKNSSKLQIGKNNNPLQIALFLPAANATKKPPHLHLQTPLLIHHGNKHHVMLNLNAILNLQPIQSPQQKTLWQPHWFAIRGQGRWGRQAHIQSMTIKAAMNHGISPEHNTPWWLIDSQIHANIPFWHWQGWQGKKSTIQITPQLIFRNHQGKILLSRSATVQTRTLKSPEITLPQGFKLRIKARRKEQPLFLWHEKLWHENSPLSWQMQTRIDTSGRTIKIKQKGSQITIAPSQILLKSHPKESQISLQSQQILWPEKALRLKKIHFQGRLISNNNRLPFTLKVHRASHHKSRPWFSPLKLTSHGQFNLNRQKLTFKGELSRPRSTHNKKIAITFNGRLNLLRQKGRVHFDTQKIFFSKKRRTLSTLTPQLATEIQQLEGMLHAKGVVHWYKNRIKPRITLKTEDLSLKWEALDILGLNSHITLTGIDPPTTAKKQHLSLTQLRLGGVPIDQIQSQFHIDRKEGIALQKFQFAFLGGHAATKIGKMNLKDKIGNLTLKISGIDLPQLTTLTKIPGLKTQGKLTGSLPVKIDHGRWAIDNGLLETEKPGWIRYTDPVAEKIAEKSGVPPLVTQVFKDYHYTKLKMTVNRSFEGKNEIKIHTLGHNPTWEHGRPVKLNLNIEGNLDQMVHRMLGFERMINLLVEKQAQLLQRKNSHP
ncbi:intermembrane phospholipid transport protein YdbH family protein [Magnetococcales bacterium HHB-1]